MSTLAMPVITPKIEEAIPQLPEVAQGQLGKLSELAVERDELLRVLNDKKLRELLRREQKQVSKQRIRILEARIESLYRICQALELGYEPFTPNSAWYGGFVDQLRRRERDSLGTGTYYLFQAPIPPSPLTKYREAKKTGLFERILVFAPQPELFRQIGSLACDPVMVGYVRLSEEMVSMKFRRWKGINPTIPVQIPPKVKGGVSFLIVQWNLGEDLAANR